MSIIIRTRDGKEFMTPYFPETTLSTAYDEIWMPVWELPVENEDDPCSSLIRVSDIVSISATTEEDKRRLHAALEYASKYGGNVA